MNIFVTSPWPAESGIIFLGTYRAHEFLTVQVLEAMVHSVNKIETGPLLGKAVVS